MATNHKLLSPRASDTCTTTIIFGHPHRTPQLNEFRSQLGNGDTVVVNKLDRLGRSTKDLLQIVSELKEKNVNLIVTQQNIVTTAKKDDCSSP